mgnify:CR=1 FL=1
MALGLTLLVITGIGIIWILQIIKRECDMKQQEKNVVKFLADEIRKLRKDVNNLKNND